MTGGRPSSVFLGRRASCETFCCGWCRCLDHAGLRYWVVMSAALQLVVVTARYRAGGPPSALQAGHCLRFRRCPTPPRLDGVCRPCWRDPTPAIGGSAAQVVVHGKGLRW